MVRRAYRQRSLVEVLLPDADKLWDPALRQIDAVLDDALVDRVAEALARRHPESRRRGRLGTPAAVVLRMLVLKHLWPPPWRRHPSFLGMGTKGLLSISPPENFWPLELPDDPESLTDVSSFVIPQRPVSDPDRGFGKAAQLVGEARTIIVAAPTRRQRRRGDT
jgi:hypothetical protein